MIPGHKERKKDNRLPAISQVTLHLPKASVKPNTHTLNVFLSKIKFFVFFTYRYATFSIKLLSIFVPILFSLIFHGRH